MTSLESFRDFFNEENFETFAMPSRLLDLMVKAAPEYKKDTTENAGNNASLAESAGTLQSSFGVYVRLTGNQQKRQLQSVDKSTTDMEKQLRELQAKRKRLSEQIASSQIKFHVGFFLERTLVRTL